MTRCVGAFLMPCDNLTERIICDRCQRVVERVLDQQHPKRVAAETRRTYSPRHAKAT